MTIRKLSQPGFAHAGVLAVAVVAVTAVIFTGVQVATHQNNNDGLLGASTTSAGPAVKTCLNNLTHLNQTPSPDQLSFLRTTYFDTAGLDMNRDYPIDKDSKGNDVKSLDGKLVHVATYSKSGPDTLRHGKVNYGLTTERYLTIYEFLKGSGKTTLDGTTMASLSANSSTAHDLLTAQISNLKAAEANLPLPVPKSQISVICNIASGRTNVGQAVKAQTSAKKAITNLKRLTTKSHKAYLSLAKQYKGTGTGGARSVTPHAATGGAPADDVPAGGTQ